jgi:hypothetical protein
MERRRRTRGGARGDACNAAARAFTEDLRRGPWKRVFVLRRLARQACRFG